jgi:hypothetical protein
MRRLRRFLMPMAAAAVSVYCGLIGSAKLLLQQDARLYGAVVLAVGVAAAPFWLKALRK